MKLVHMYEYHISIHSKKWKYISSPGLLHTSHFSTVQKTIKKMIGTLEGIFCFVTKFHLLHSNNTAVIYTTMKCLDRIKFCLIFTVFYLGILLILPFATDLEHFVEDLKRSEETETHHHQPKPNFEERRKLLDEICQKYSDPSKPEFAQITNTKLAKMNHFNYFWHNFNYTMICSIQKVGSNSVHHFINNILEDQMSRESSALNQLDFINRQSLENPEDETKLLKMPVNQDCWPDCAKELTKVILVRHPLERLLSAYLYIFTNRGKYHFAKYSWNQFVSNVINYPDDPEWITIQQKVGNHWAPYWKSCQVCDVNLRPNYVLKLESLEDDIFEYLSQIGLAQYAHDFPWINPHQGHKTAARLIEFYSRLSLSTIEELYHVYKLDHDLFGYDPTSFYYLASEYTNPSHGV